MSGMNGNAEQLSLDLFPPESFDQLRTHISSCSISVHVNRRLKSNWYVRIHRNSGRRELHVPPVLGDAPERVKSAVVNWAALPSPRNSRERKELRIRRREYEELIRAYLHEHAPADVRPPPRQKWPTRGCRWDLSEVFDTLNGRYFQGALTSLLRWGTCASKTSYQSTRKLQDGSLAHCITIAGTYDHPDVPRFAIESIMFHEMLHIRIPPRRENGRNIMHGTDFKTMEKSFPHYGIWRQWERECLPGIRRKLLRRHRLHQIKRHAARLLLQ